MFLKEALNAAISDFLIAVIFLSYSASFTTEASKLRFFHKILRTRTFLSATLIYTNSSFYIQKCNINLLKAKFHGFCINVLNFEMCFSSFFVVSYSDFSLYCFKLII